MGKEYVEPLDEVEFEEEIESEDEESEEEIESEEEETESEDEESEEEVESEEEESEELIVSIGDEEPKPDETKAAAPWVKELRKAHREIQKENRELRARLDEKEKPAKIEVGVKPTLEDPDIDWDSDKYEKAISEWIERKRKVEEQSAEVEKRKEADRAEWQTKLDAYEAAKTKLKVKDFDDSEAVALEVLDVTQQGIIVQGAENPALLIYALGKNSTKVQELAKIKDPVKFTFAVAKMEKDLKVKNRKSPPPPEKTVKGTAPKSGTVDSTLERLRKDAEKTGNYTKVAAYKRQLRSKT